MKQFLIRDKFKTELGKKIFDELINIAPSLNDLYFLFTLIKGDEKKQILLNFLNGKNKSWEEIDEFVIENWG